jgi:hypothetical protein
MRMSARWISATAVVFLAMSLPMTFSLPAVQGAADHVRWDIIHFDATTTPPTVSAGGVAFASARNPSSLSIRLTGSGTFVASGGTSGAVTGGGTWETFSGTTSTGSGTYEVVGLTHWTFSNLQPPVLTDLIDGGIPSGPRPRHPQVPARPNVSRASGWASAKICGRHAWSARPGAFGCRS